MSKSRISQFRWLIIAVIVMVLLALAASQSVADGNPKCFLQTEKCGRHQDIDVGISRGMILLADGTLAASRAAERPIAGARLLGQAAVLAAQTFESSID